MPEFTPQKIPRKAVSLDELLALFCYKFPQYTYLQAKKLPYKRIRQMLKAAQKEDARVMYEFTQIVAGPHTKKGKTVKKMLEYYKKEMEK